MAKEIQQADVVVTTAQVPGRRAPTLVPAKVVEGMRPGSVIVDLAAEGGGNCELTRAGEDVVAHGVTILGPRNLPASVPGSASQLYSNNLVNFLGLIVREGALALDLEDELVRGALACHRGEVTHERIREALSS